MLAKTAKEALEDMPEAVRKEHPEMVEHLDEVDNIKNIDEGFEGGKILDENDLDELTKNLKLKFGTNLELVEEFKDKSVLAQFVAETNTIRYKKGATNYQIFHESLHAEECYKIGKPNYLKGSSQYGGTISEQIQRTYEREKYVYERIKLNAKKQGFNERELEHNQLLFDWHSYNLKHYK